MNIFELVFMEYSKHMEEQGKKPKSGIEDFVKFSKDFLEKHPPVELALVDYGMALKLQNGSVVTFSEARPLPKPGKAVTISNPEVVNSGISDSFCMPITNPFKK